MEGRHSDVPPSASSRAGGGGACAQFWHADKTVIRPSRPRASGQEGTHGGDSEISNESGIRQGVSAEGREGAREDDDQKLATMMMLYIPPATTTESSSCYFLD